MSKKQIFISHTKDEADFAESLSTWFKNILDKQIRVFVSSDNGESIPLGSEWLEKIKESLKSTNIILVLVSHKSIEKKWIHFEAGAGYIRNIPVIPVCIGGITAKELPDPLNFLQAVELPNDKNELALIKKIIKITNLNLPESFKKFLELNKLQLPDREITSDPKFSMLTIPVSGIQECVIESDITIRIVQFLADYEKDFTISELELSAQIKELRRRKYVLKILEEISAQGILEKRRIEKRTTYKVTKKGKSVLEKIKKTHAVRPV